MTAWQDDAACRGMDPDLFFPERGETTREARLVCAGCTVRLQCLEYALDNLEKHGLWGGLSERERRRVRRLRAEGAPRLAAVDLPKLDKRRGRRRAPVAQCGTYAGYKRHRRAGEPVCDDCRVANNQARQIWLVRQRRRETA